MSDKNAKNLVWIDLELTGLDLKKDKILEIAIAVTDKNLKILQAPKNWVVNHPEKLLKQMDDWNKKHHGASNLIEEVLNSRLTTKEVEEEVLEYIKPYTKENLNLLAGASVHVDRLFLSTNMPKLEKYFKFQILDIASIRALAYRWYNLEAYPKNNKHRAYDDVVESIAELQYFRASIFKEYREV